MSVAIDNPRAYAPNKSDRTQKPAPAVSAKAADPTLALAKAAGRAIGLRLNRTVLTGRQSAAVVFTLGDA
ncbi:hypothetical protein [Glutamicibacter nicotianae]|uniref:hypothetical protein n=1 Tax=Glutamicibacter nicotianae TaxID=37929 RepID=UPI00057969CA|nr:hypothetical protein [Glutamicibacter nicotianae]KWR73784.1 hypothetical protein RN04_00750 [Arthrobacter sp. W1]MBM7767791.1 hypothetical protein [Glutamicibacter nicotianae]